MNKNAEQSDGSKASVDRPRSVRSRLLGLDHRGRYFADAIRLDVTWKSKISQA